MRSIYSPACTCNAYPRIIIVLSRTSMYRLWEGTALRVSAAGLLQHVCGVREL